MDEKTKVVGRTILNCGWAVGIVYSIRNVYSSDLRPFYKWNLIVALALTVPDAIKKGLNSIDEFGKLIDETDPDDDVVSETEES